MSLAPHPRGGLPAGPDAVRSDDPARAGGSAWAQYRRELVRGRSRRLLVRALKAAVPAVLVALVIGWRLGLALAAVVALADWWRFRRWSDVAAWRKGALGERATARMLASLALDGYVVLHDRAIAGSSANLDHVVVGPTGVWVVDSKRWARRTRISGFGRRVWIGRRPADTLLRGLAFEREAVQRGVNGFSTSPIQVSALVAVHGPRLPGISRPLQVEGIMLVRAGQSRRLIKAGPATLAPAAVSALASALDRSFPPYE